MSQAAQQAGLSTLQKPRPAPAIKCGCKGSAIKWTKFWARRTRRDSPSFRNIAADTPPLMDRQDTDFLRWLRTSRRSTEYLRKTRDAMANPAKMEEWIEAGGGLDSAVMAAADGLTGDEMVDLSRKLFTATGDKQLYSEFGRGQLNQFRRRIGEMAIAEMSRPDRAGKRLSSFMGSPEGREALQRMYTHFKNNPEGRFLRAAAMDEMLFTPVARKGNPKQVPHGGS